MDVKNAKFIVRSVFLVLCLLHLKIILKMFIVPKLRLETEQIFLYKNI